MSKKKYVEFKHTTNSILLNLPPGYDDYTGELMRDLTENFGYEAITVPVLEQMNTFVVEWFKKKDITLS